MLLKCLKMCSKQLLAYLNIHDFITPDQSAFLKDHSTVTALHKITDNWLNNIEEGLITVVFYFDNTKCFDVINHDILLFKLMKYGIRGSALMWFESYLKDRMQATLLHNNLSTFLPVDCGVPQGSLLGPVLFLLFINDLPKYVFNCNLYADDTMIDRCGKSLTEVVPLIQGDVDKLCKWFSDNKFSISVNKSCSMVIGSQFMVKDYISKDTLGIKVNDIYLENRPSYMYLGAEIDSFLSWNNTINNVVKKLQCKIAALQRLSNCMPMIDLTLFNYAFIQPHIDYCLSVWGHTSKHNIQMVQRFQNRAARIISHNFDYSVSSRSYP